MNASADSGVTWRRFVALAVPNVLANLMVPLAGLVDTALLGHLDQMHWLAGVGLASIVFDYLYWSFGFLRMGTTGLTAQASGASDDDEAHLVWGRAALLALAIGGAILVLAGPVEQLAFWLLDGEPAVEAAGRDYFRGRIVGAPITLFNFALLGWFLGRQRADKVMWMSIAGSIANIGLDLWFVWELGWQSYGAGLATALSQVVAATVGVALMRPRSTLARVWALRSRLWDLDRVRALAALSGDILVRTFALLTAFALFTNYSAALSTTVLTANTVLLKALSTAAFFIDGYAYATESLAGWAKGRKDGPALRRLLGIAMRVGVVTGLVFGLAFFAFPGLFGLLSDHREVLEVAKDFRGWLLAVLAFSSVAYVLDGYFLGLAAGSTLRRAMLWSLGLGFLPLALYARFGAESAGLLWAAMVSFMAARALSLSLHVKKTFEIS